MRKNILVVILGLAMLLLAGIAGAEPMKLTDNTKFTDDGTVDGYGVKSLDYNSHGWGDVNRLDGSSDYVSWTHHYGFTPPAGEVIDGSLTLWLRDDSGRDPFEFAFGWAEDGTLGFGEVDTIDYTYPEPATMLLLGSGLIGISSVGRKKFFKR